MKKSAFLLRGTAALLTIGAFLPLFSASAQPPSAPESPAKNTLTITLDKLRSNKGTLEIRLFVQDKGYPDNREQAFKTRAMRLSESMKAGTSQVTVTFTDLLPGTYALAAHHDENSNSKLDKHWYGKPKEGVGASNNPRPRNRAVRFNEAKFDMGSASKAINISVWYP